jgi:ribosome-binding protein aMBF1 (putative translation factor)
MTKNLYNYKNDILGKILSEITPEEQHITDKKMLIAYVIDNAIKENGWKNEDVAIKMNIKPSLVSLWLSGTYNFNLKTLSKLEKILGINLINII